jgi:3-oxoacyl-[acyl-carrier protein] reductase
MIQEPSQQKQTALVLGGASALGQEVVRKLCAEGVHTMFTYFRSAPAAKALAEETDAKAYALDVTKTQAIRDLITGLPVPVDTFVHCITLGPNLTLEQIADADWDHIHAVNVRSAFVAAQALVPKMKAHGGNMVFTVTLDGLRPVPAPAHFAATQGALSGLIRALAKELGTANIRGRTRCWRFHQSCCATTRRVRKVQCHG